jgi:hypothetical protein
VEEKDYLEEEEEEEEEEEQEEHPDLLACRPCGLAFAHVWGLKDHQIRGCLVDEPPAKRCKREDDGVEDTYDYELECYLKDLPATVCYADQLPARVENRAQSFVVNTDSCDREGTHWVAFYFPKRRTRRIFRFVRTSTGNVSPSLQKRADRQRTAIQVQHSSSSTRGWRHLWTLLRSLPQIQIWELYSVRYHERILRSRPKDDRGRIK